MQNMELWTVFYLVSFLNVAFGSLYSIHLNKLSFKDAQNYCKPGGFLTSLSSESELAEIQKAIWEKNNKTATSFWIGLKKKKGQCVDQNTPLNGFRWTEDDGEYLHNINWREKPMRTCTDERCGRLLVEYSDSGTINEGLGDAACKQMYAFICKRNFEKCPPPSILDSHDIIEPANDPNTRHITCSSGATFTLKCSINLLWNVEGDENSDVSQLCLQCKSGYRRDASGSCVDINECQPFNPCKHTCLNTDGSYKCVCPYNKDSDDCRESTTPTADLDNNDVHPTYSTESLPIHSDGVSKNETAVQIEEQDGDISNIVVPVIIALLIFVVLMVIIAAIVKGCLRRRDVKRARKKAEAVALNGSNSMEKGNENKGHEII